MRTYITKCLYQMEVNGCWVRLKTLRDMSSGKVLYTVLFFLMLWPMIYFSSKRQPRGFVKDYVNIWKTMIYNDKNMENVITLRDKKGKIILRRTPDLILNETLRKMNPREESLAFIHIGKAGGTSFEAALHGSVLKENGCKLYCSKRLNQLRSNQSRCSKVRPMLCFKHFDWSVIKRAEKKGFKMAPVILFREPVSRAVSHFHFARTLKFTEDKRIRGQTLNQYLKDVNSMMDTHSIWSDGQVCRY